MGRDGWLYLGLLSKKSPVQKNFIFLTVLDLITAKFQLIPPLYFPSIDKILAVFVIIGILSLIAIPSVSNAIESSRKEALIEQAKTYLNCLKEHRKKKRKSWPNPMTVSL